MFGSINLNEFINSCKLKWATRQKRAAKARDLLKTCLRNKSIYRTNPAEPISATAERTKTSPAVINSLHRTGDDPWALNGFNKFSTSIISLDRMLQSTFHNKTPALRPVEVNQELCLMLFLLWWTHSYTLKVNKVNNGLKLCETSRLQRLRKSKTRRNRKRSFLNKLYSTTETTHYKLPKPLTMNSFKDMKSAYMEQFIFFFINIYLCEAEFFVKTDYSLKKRRLPVVYHKEQF